ncbi:MAG: ABC transporter ATP-binding protein [Eubacteriales bacterium]|nr:ABC transporter ATP-binding protein [Eubacteriales bacterium]
MSILDAIDIIKQYTVAENVITAVDRANLSVKEGEFVAIIGASGSGKSTLINICAGLESPNSGTVMLGGHDLTRMKPNQLTAFRGKNVGFIFQSHKLIPYLTAYENIILPLNAADRRLEKHQERLKLLIDSLGIGDRLHHLPGELSGGQQQRVAIARALIHYPRILFADEPTGNLDRHNADEVLELMIRLKNDLNQTMVVVTHDMVIANRADRILVMDDGHIAPYRKHAV